MFHITYLFRTLSTESKTYLFDMFHIPYLFRTLNTESRTHLFSMYLSRIYSSLPYLSFITFFKKCKIFQIGSKKLKFHIYFILWKSHIFFYYIVITSTRNTMFRVPKKLSNFLIITISTQEKYQAEMIF